MKPILLGTLSDRPLVSVLVANYNYEHYLKDAIESVLRQTYTRFELIICDDGSTDGSCAVVETYALRDSRIRLIRKGNGGVASALNAAHQQSEGEFICLLDADDTYYETKLERLISLARRHPEVGFFSHAVNLVDRSGSVWGRRPVSTDTRQMDAGWIAERAIREGGASRLGGGSAISMRRPIAEALFPIPEEPFQREADAFILSLAALLTPVMGTNEVMSSYRIHDSNVTGLGGSNVAAITKSLEIKKRVATAVNHRLTELRIEETVDCRNDPTVMRLNCLLCLLLGDRQAFFHHFTAYARYMLKARHLGLTDRVLRLAHLALAVMLPERAGKWWLGAGLGSTGFKRRIYGVLRPLRHG